MAANGRGRHASDARDRGFTLVEIVIAIVLTGVLAAVVVVGVGRLVEQGSAAGCAASADAARAAVLVHRTMTGSAPASFSDLLGSGALEGSEGVTTVAGGMALAGSDWTLVWYGNGERPPRLECSTVDLGTPGLTAEVFNSSNFTNPIQTMTHTTGTSANWGYGTPLTGLGMGEAFSVRYTGTITIPTSGTWTFTSTADNAVTIWINDQRLLTNNATATAAIAAGTYPLRIDFTEVSHAASWTLTWTPPGTTTATTVPATALTTATIPTVTTTPPAPTLALDTTTATTASFRITPTPTHPKILGNTATTLTCTAPGQPTRTSTTPTWLIGVDQLTTGTTYTCTATLDGSPPSPPVTVTPTPTPTTPGLTATIHHSTNFANPIQTVTHTGPTSANWGYGTPLTGLGMGEAFSVRYTGTITIPTSGTWTFTSTADNAVTIWINDQRLLTNNATATAAIAAGTYPLRIDFTEVSHAASWTLTWTAPGSSTATTIPATALTTA